MKRIVVIRDKRGTGKIVVQGIPLVEFSRNGIAGDIALLRERIK